MLPRKIPKSRVNWVFKKKLIILTLLKSFKFVILICVDYSRIDNNKITQPQGTREIYRGSTLKSLIFSLKTYLEALKTYLKVPLGRINTTF